MWLLWLDLSLLVVFIGLLITYKILKKKKEKREEIEGEVVDNDK